MPIYEYKCILCDEVVERLVSLSNGSSSHECEKCGGWLLKIPSIPAWRPDKTTQVVVDD